MKSYKYYLIVVSLNFLIVNLSAQERVRMGSVTLNQSENNEVFIPPILNVQIGENWFTDENDNKGLDASETATIAVNINNSGRGRASDLELKVAAAHKVKGLDISYPTWKFDVEPGESIRKLITLKGTMDLEDAIQNLTIRVLEPHGLHPDPIKLSFETLRLLKPELKLYDSQFSAIDGGIIELNKQLNVLVRIFNSGEGIARNVKLMVEYEPNIVPVDPVPVNGEIFLKLGNIPAGDYVDYGLSFVPNKNYFKDSIYVYIKGSEDLNLSSFNERIGTPLNTMSSGSITNVSMKAVEREQTAIVNPVRLIADVDTNIPKRDTIVNESAIAVVIGNRDYKETKAVEYAINDSRMIKQYLKDVLGYKDENILYRENATSADFNTIFGTKSNHKGRLFGMIDETIDEVFIYYSGHGAPDISDNSNIQKTGYFVPVDCNPNYVSFSGYSSEVLYDNLSKLKVEKISVVLDACFSGAEILDGISPVGIKPKKFNSIKNGVLLSSSSGTEVSSWFEDQKHGLFTYYFLKGIQTFESDINGDRTITYGEMSEYLRNKVPREARRLKGIPQNPSINGSNPDLVFMQY